MSKLINKQLVNEDEQYLIDSLAEIQSRLLTFRYNIKEIKACMVIATEENNTNRIQVLFEQKTKTNDLIKAGLEDQKRVLSIYKMLKRLNSK